jgi:hypothetical protein
MADRMFVEIKGFIKYRDVFDKIARQNSDTSGDLISSIPGKTELSVNGTNVAQKMRTNKHSVEGHALVCGWP